MALERSDSFAAFQVPDTQGLVRRARDDAAAVGGQGQGIDRPGMALEPTNSFAAFQVPDAQGLVRRAGDHAPAVGGKRHGSDLLGMALERTNNRNVGWSEAWA